MRYVVLYFKIALSQRCFVAILYEIFFMRCRNVAAFFQVRNTTPVVFRLSGNNGCIVQPAIYIPTVRAAEAF